MPKRNLELNNQYKSNLGDEERGQVGTAEGISIGKWNNTKNITSESQCK